MAQGISRRAGGFIAVGLTLALAALIQVQALTAMSSDAAMFPRLIALVMAAAAAVLLLKTLLLPRGDPARPLFAGIRWKTLFSVSALWLLSMLLPPYLGFYTDIFLFMAVASCCLAGFSKKSLGKSLLYSLAVTLLLWGVFSAFLRFSLPKGWFM